jgi:hypothetical protein
MGLLVCFSSIRYRTSTLHLSNWYSFSVLIMKSNLGVSFALNMLSALIYSELSYSTMQQVATIDTPEVRPPRSSRTRGRSPQISTSVPDINRTVSRRSEPSSRTTLIGEQPNPWKVLPLQDVMSRHRGAKQRRLCELLGAISLLSPG